MLEPQARDNIFTIQDSKEQSPKLDAGLPKLDCSSMTQRQCVFYAEEHNSTIGEP